MAKQTWQSPESAPKDGTVILGYVGWPWPVPCAFNAASSEWVVAVIQVESDGNEFWFENAYEPESALKLWMPVPNFEELK